MRHRELGILEITAGEWKVGQTSLPGVYILQSAYREQTEWMKIKDKDKQGEIMKAVNYRDNCNARLMSASPKLLRFMLELAINPTEEVRQEALELAAELGVEIGSIN